jgi:tetrahydromethanopterin S-methyltransferase subunit C
VSPVDPDVPPPGEEIHLPGPSLLPVLLAVGITLGLVGVTLGPVFWVSGVILSVVVVVRWVADTRREIDELPAEHHTV